MISSCSAPVKNYTTKLHVTSVSYKFIDELFTLNAKHKRHNEIPVWVSLPDAAKFASPYPAIVLLHSSWGLSSQESYYAEVFANMGIATYVVDSFSPRGVGKTSMDQSLVSSASMIQDAYQVLSHLQNVPEINNEKIAVMGFSKGGIAALYSALNEIQSAVNKKEDVQFAAHIAYYPWCGIRLQNMKTTSAEILIQGGDKDIITPVNKCVQLVEEKLTSEEKLRVAIEIHANTRHAFDHPVLSKIPIPISLNAQVPGSCEIHENIDGDFVEILSNVKVTGNNIKSVLEECSSFNGIAGYSSEATEAALEITKKFLRHHLM